MARHDPHSYADDTQVRITRFDWAATIDFAQHQVDASVTLEFDDPRGGLLHLDTRALTIHSVKAGETPVAYTLGLEDPVLGTRLELQVPAGTPRLTIDYRTSPKASALQWLEPAQTLGGEHPFLFSQCQAIHARSIIPLQDSPKHRVPYRASLKVPKQLKAVMAAGFVSRREEGDWAVETYDMPQPIPPYLLAFAVGDLVSLELTPRSRVWAEPKLVEKAAREFADVEKMMVAAESLFGPYDWERFDILTMPPSFPYGGMENPRLTFVTPALVVGDKSLVDVIAHELAHSWTGNLVTNANAEHFWLNEGFTVYAERRITEALEGEDAALLSAALGRRELDDAIARFAAHPELTRLRTSLTGVDPDEAFSVVPYEKGFLFLKLLEAKVGRPRFDALLKRWLSAHRFKAVTTYEFIEFFEREAPGVLQQVDAERWLAGAGVPANAPVFHSARLAAVEQVGTNGPSPELAAKWGPTEWVLWLGKLPKQLTLAQVEALEQRYQLTSSKNPEIVVAWLPVALRAGQQAALARTDDVLSTYGRMKYLRPLYSVLSENEKTRPEARRIFDKNAPRYHPIAQHVVRGLLEP